MIVTSKRCFMNILSQYMPLETLLNANYFIADYMGPQVAGFNDVDKLSYDSNGQLLVEHPSDTIQTRVAPKKYNVTYGSGELDGVPYMTTILVGDGDIDASPEQRFIDHLRQPATNLAIYQFLFNKPLRGNGMQILIYYDEDNLKYFTYIACQYLATYFGVDIEFMDPRFRSNIKGYPQYVGNKATAAKHIADIRDYKLWVDFNDVLSQSGISEGSYNLATWLSMFTTEQLMHLYNLLFPNMPLPPDNCTSDHIKQIIIGRTMNSQNSRRNTLDSIFTTDDFISLMDAYHNEIREESFDDIS